MHLFADMDVDWLASFGVDFRQTNIYVRKIHSTYFSGMEVSFVLNYRLGSLRVVL